MPRQPKRSRKRYSPLRINKGIRTARAYHALVWLLATARWMQAQLESQMHHFGIRMSEFHILDVLRRNGPQYPEAVSRRLGMSRAHTYRVLRRLFVNKFIQVRAWRLPSRPQRKNSFDIGVRYGGKAAGRRVILVDFTPEGRHRFIDFIARHVKLVKAHMRTLDQREQVTLAHLLQKLRKGDPWKFMTELRYSSEAERLWDVWGAKTRPDDGEVKYPEGILSPEIAAARDDAIQRIDSFLKKYKTRPKETN